MPYTAQTSIRGPSAFSPVQFYGLAKAHGGQRLDDVQDYLDEVYVLCAGSGIRAEVVVIQAIHETDWFRSFWWRHRCNPAGIGITGDPAQNANSRNFENGMWAARAHVVHLALYAIGTDLPDALKPYQAEDPRWQAAINAGYAGVCTTIGDLTNTWAADDQYAAKLVRHLTAIVGGTPEDAPVDDNTTIDNGLVGQIVGQLTDIAASQYAPPRLLPYLEQADPGNIVVREGNNVFFRVDAEVRATVDTPRYQRAADNAAEVGPILTAGETATVGWAWLEENGALWLYSSYGTRFRGKDFVRTDGAPITPPDTGPLPPVVEPPAESGEITAENFRLVEDPTILLPPIAWEGTANFFPNRQGFGDPIAIFYHCTDDLYYPNTKNWFQTQGSNASSHFVIERDGTVHQFVSSADGAWTNGDVKQPRRDIPWLADILDRGVNPNNAGISYEHVATPEDPPTEAQYQSAIALSRYFCHPKVYGINPNRSHQMRHADVNSVTRSYCPGPDFDLERIIEALGGDSTQLAA